MAKAVIMPKAGITVESCIIGQWQKKVGDKIAVGDILFTYETDKASFECESTEEGTLLEIFFNDGDEVPCLVNVCAVGNEGEDCSALKPNGVAEAPAEPVAEEKAEVKDSKETDKIYDLLKKSTGKQQFYREMLKIYGLERGVEVYKTVRPEYTNLTKLVRK